MFLAHYAVALAGKKATSEVKLGTLMVAAQFLDLLWPVLLLFGVEHVRIHIGDTIVTPLDFYDYPISHSALTVVCWAIAGGVLYYVRRKSLSGSMVIACAVASHWVLDFLTHRPDLPLAPGSTAMYGLGIWNSFWWTVALEASFYCLGIALYLWAMEPIDRSGRISFFSLIFVLAGIYAINLTSPPPPTPEAIAYGSLLLWAFVPWAYYIDRHWRPRRAHRLVEPVPSE